MQDDLVSLENLAHLMKQPTKHPQQIAAERAVALLGGPVSAARRLDVERYQTVQSWTRNRIPAEYCPSIERELNGQIKCEEMRPDVDWAYLRLAIEPHNDDIEPRIVTSNYQGPDRRKARV